MSFLRRREHRRGRVATAATTVAVLGAFQVLAIIGAGSASAVTGCTYNPATQTVTITIDPGQFAGVTVEDADDADAESPSGAILFDNNGLGFEDGANTTQCGSASNSNTTSIVVLGSPGNDEFFYIDQGAFVFGSGGAAFSSSIAWAIDMGSNTVGGGDTVEINLTSSDDELVLTDTTFDMNGGAGTLLGVEFMTVRAHEGDDVLDASATVNMITSLNNGTGDDWAAPGASVGDWAYGGDGWDTLSYGSRTTCTVIDAVAGEAGMDFNCDGDLADLTDEVDGHGAFEAYETGSGNDSLYGAGGVDEWFIPGDGDDYVEGQAGDDDVLDFSTASAAVTIDSNTAVGTAVGQGSDEFVDVFGFVGSDFDDVLIWDADVWGFAGGGGIDTVDASAKTTAQVIDLDLLDDLLTADSTENAIGGSADDLLAGNDLRNQLEGGDGNDNLDGWGGNDVFFGGLGNDDFWGGLGADTVDFGASPAGIDADVSLGFATGEGDDSFEDFVEIVKGSAFNDQITGGKTGLGSSINNRITGRAGNDILTGSDSNDFLKGGAGNDKLRGLEGGDTLKGGKGKDKGWGGPGTDVCKGVEKAKSCEI